MKSDHIGVLQTQMKLNWPNAPVESGVTSEAAVTLRSQP